MTAEEIKQAIENVVSGARMGQPKVETKAGQRYSKWVQTGIFGEGEDLSEVAFPEDKKTEAAVQFVTAFTEYLEEHSDKVLVWRIPPHWIGWDNQGSWTKLGKPEPEYKEPVGAWRCRFALEPAS